MTSWRQYAVVVSYLSENQIFLLAERSTQYAASDAPFLHGP